MKWFYGILILGIIPVLFSLFSKQEQAVLEERNHFKNINPSLKSKVKLALNQSFTFLHVGDSHIQIGGISKGILDYLNQHQVAIQSAIHFPISIFGDLYNPDFEIYSYRGIWQGTTLTNENNKEIIGLAGRNFTFSGEKGKIEIRSKNKINPIEKVAILHEKPEITFECKKAITSTIKINDQLYKTSFNFTKKQKKIKLKIKLSEGKTFHCYGIFINEDLSKHNYYNAGVSGVKYLDFFRTKEFFNQLEWMRPTFLCFSLGTNDGYSPLLDTNTFEKNLREFILKIKRISPETILIGMTAPDTYYQKQIPKHLTLVNESIRTIFNEQAVILWDWEEIMGGKGSIQTWSQEGLVASDLLHFNQKGYELIGKSFANALLSLQNE